LDISDIYCNSFIGNNLFEISQHQRTLRMNTCMHSAGFWKLNSDY